MLRSVDIIIFITSQRVKIVNLLLVCVLVTDINIHDSPYMIQ